MLGLQVGVVRLTLEVPPDVELIFESKMGIALIHRLALAIVLHPLQLHLQNWRRRRDQADVATSGTRLEFDLSGLEERIERVVDVTGQTGDGCRRAGGDVDE